MILLPSFASLAAVTTVALLSHAMKRLDYGHRMIDHRQILGVFSLVFLFQHVQESILRIKQLANTFGNRHLVVDRYIAALL